MIRTAKRPLYKQLYHNIEQLSEWQSSVANLVMFIHGEEKAAHYEARAWEKAGFNVVNAAGKTNNAIVGAVDYLLTHSVATGYEFVAFMDDDFSWREPKTALDLCVKEFDERPKLGAFGPINGYVLWTRYNNRKGYFFAEMTGRPWATFGYQIYRNEYLRHLDLSPLKKMWVRSDVFLFSSMFHAGYQLGEAPIPHRHTCSVGINKPKYDAGYRKKMTARTKKSYDVMREHFADWPEFVKHLNGMEKADYRKVEKKFAKYLEEEDKE